MRTDPRWLDAANAADYISVRPDAMPRLVKQGRIPPPSYQLGPRQPRWDRLALDAVFEGGTSSTDIDQVAEAIARDIRAGR